MSIAAMNWAWAQDVGEHSELLVLLALADHADHAGKCWPGAAHVARKARLDERTVPRVIRRLEAMGLVRVEHQQGKPNRYLLNLAGEAWASASATEQRTPGAAPGVEAEDPRHHAGGTPGAIESGVTPGATPGVSHPTPGARSQGTPGARSQGNLQEPSNNLQAGSAGARADGAPVPGQGEPPGALTDGQLLAKAIAFFKLVRPKMREAVGESDWNTWLAGLWCVGASPGRIMLGAPTRFIADRALEMVPRIEAAIELKVEIVVRSAPRGWHAGAA